ncbi:MAG: hypothetical protein J6K48_03350 [Lachnospiraceae bacterium]|nr:hypothetical protein [Lachnospiraceae bacterium]
MSKEKTFYDNNSIDISNVDSKVSLFFRLPTPFQMPMNFAVEFRMTTI